MEELSGQDCPLRPAVELARPVGVATWAARSVAMAEPSAEEWGLGAQESRVRRLWAFRQAVL